MFAPAPLIVRGYHVTALHNAYGLMAAAAETGKPHACWAHHKTVGGAKVADELVALGYFSRRLDAIVGQVDTFFYRITAEGCAYISQPYLLEDLSMSETPAPDVEATSPAPIDLSYPPKAAAPELKIVDSDALNDAERLRIKAADALMALSPDEAQLLATFPLEGKIKVAISAARIDLTKRGLIELLYRRGLHEDPFMQLTPLGKEAAALQAEMRIDADDVADEPLDEAAAQDEPSAELPAVGTPYMASADEDDDVTVDEDALRQRFAFKRGDRVHLNGFVGTVDSTDIYPFVLFEADSDHKLVKVSEHDLELIAVATIPEFETDDSPRATKEIPAVELDDVEQPDEVAELRADRDALIAQQLDMERQIVALRDQLAAVKSALADEDGVIPEDPALAIAGLKLRISDQQQTVEGLTRSFDTMQEKCAVLEQEREVTKREITGLKLQIANLANSGDMGIQHEETYKTTPQQVTERVLAGWEAWHKELTPDGLYVMWQRKPGHKPARRGHERAQVTGPAAPASYIPRPAPVGGGVLQPSAIIDPAEPEPAPLTAMSAVMSSFTRNLQAQFESNPIPQFSVTPGAKQPDLPAR